MLMLPVPVRTRLFLDISPSCQHSPILEPWCELIVVGARRRYVWPTSRFPGQAHRFLDLSLSRQRGAILALWWKQKNPLVSFLVCHGYKVGKVPGDYYLKVYQSTQSISSATRSSSQSGWASMHAITAAQSFSLTFNIFCHL